MWELVRPLFKLVHAADIHLDSPLHGLERYEGAPIDEMRGATRRACVNLVDLCSEEGAEALLLAGDLYDGDWRDFGTGLFFTAQMVRLRDAGVRVFLVRGNHDALSRITKNLRLPDNVHVFSTQHPETVVDERLGIAVHGQSFAKAEVLKDLSAAYPLPVKDMLNIGLLHSSAGGRPGHANYAPCRVQDLVAKGYDYWALGHVHAREVLKTDPWVVFSGNLQGRHARETGPKGATMVTVEHGRIDSVAHRPLDAVRWALVEIDAAGCSAPTDVLDRLAAALRSQAGKADGRVCALRLRISGCCAAHGTLLNRREAWIADSRALAADVGSGAFWVEKVVFETAPEVDWAEGASRSGPLAELVRDIESLRGDDARIRELVAKFSELNAKLPLELKDGDEPFHADEARVRELLGAVEALLLPRLVAAEAER